MHMKVCVPELVMTYGNEFNPLNMGVNPSILLGCLLESRKSYKELKRNPEIGRKEITTLELEALNNYIKSLDIDDIGFTNVESSMIFKNKKVLFNNAIVLTMEMKRDKIDLAPSAETKEEIFRTYFALGKAVNKIANYLRQEGFSAQAGPAIGGDVNYVTLAEAAGLGAIGNHGLLITPRFGPSIRLAAVYTDIENLPLGSKDHQWIKSFCDNCNVCKKECLGHAIHEDPIEFEDGSLQCADYKKCSVPFSNQFGCTMCVKNCSFYKLSYEKLKGVTK